MAVYSLISTIHEQSNEYSLRTKAILEEEIRTLRVRMEQLAQAENSFTSDAVIQLSMLLDEKINEYNEYIRNIKTN
jgi:hypothetical protein